MKKEKGKERQAQCLHQNEKGDNDYGRSKSKQKRR